MVIGIAHLRALRAVVPSRQACHRRGAHALARHAGPGHGPGRWRNVPRTAPSRAASGT